MIPTAEFVADLVRLNGNELVGKTRFQKTAYFLETRGVGYGFDFEYYHYGPYSEDLALAIDDAVALDEIDLEWKFSSNTQPFAVFRLKSPGEIDITDKVSGHRKKLLRILARYDSVSLELAATADFLEKSGYSDPWAETQNRKPTKSNPERFTKAKMLLDEIRSEPMD